jgi:hypothetical protein
MPNPRTWIYPGFFEDDLNASVGMSAEGVPTINELAKKLKVPTSWVDDHVRIGAVGIEPLPLVSTQSRNVRFFAR